MGKLVFGMMQSLDGYVAGVAGGPGSDGYAAGVAGGLELSPPGVSLHRHFNDHVRGLAGSLCGRRMYEVMRYWDEDQPEWEVVEHDFAAAWRAQPKWVVSRSLKSVGANAALVAGDVEAFVRRLKAEVEGEIGDSGRLPTSAQPSIYSASSLAVSVIASVARASSRHSGAKRPRSRRFWKMHSPVPSHTSTLHVVRRRLTNRNRSPASTSR